MTFLIPIIVAAVIIWLVIETVNVRLLVLLLIVGSMAAVGIAMLVAMAVVYPWTLLVLIPAIILMYLHQRPAAPPPPEPLPSGNLDWTQWPEWKVELPPLPHQWTYDTLIKKYPVLKKADLLRLCPGLVLVTSPRGLTKPDLDEIYRILTTDPLALKTWVVEWPPKKDSVECGEWNIGVATIEYHQEHLWCRQRA